MPRYFFHCADGGRDPDLHGSELPDDDAAKLEAMRYAGAILQAAPVQMWEKGQWRVEVTGIDGALLFTVVTLALCAPKPGQLRIAYSAND